MFAISLAAVTSLQEDEVRHYASAFLPTLSNPSTRRKRILARTKRFCLLD